MTIIDNINTNPYYISSLVDEYNNCNLSGNEWLTERDFKKIFDLSDIDVILQSIPAHYIYEGSSETVSDFAEVDPVDPVESIEQALISKIHKEFCDEQQFQYQYIIPAALNLANNHWVYLQTNVDPLNREIKIKLIDGLSISDEKRFRLESIFQEVGRRLENNTSYKFDSNIQIMGTGMQTDSHACGIYVLKEIFANVCQAGQNTEIAYQFYTAFQKAGENSDELRTALCQQLEIYNNTTSDETIALLLGQEEQYGTYT